MPNSNEFNHKGPNIHTQKNVGLGLGKQPKHIPKKPQKIVFIPKAQTQKQKNS